MPHRAMLRGALGAAILLSPLPCRGDPPRAAVFAFELDDTSLQGALQGSDAADLSRLRNLDAQLATLLMQSGKYQPVPVAAEPRQPSRRTCGGCEIDAARNADAQVSIIGWVQKVSNLILNINVVVRDVATGRRIGGGSVDIRGDTDESWTRGLAYLMRNRILIPAAAE
jgi:hypothetical protein